MSEKIKLYHNSKNCCYVSSLLSILFFSNGGYFISNMLCQTLDSIKYQNGVKTIKSDIKDLNVFATKVQQLLNDMFFDLKRKIKPHELMKLLNECDNRMVVGQFHNPSEVYELLCGLFPQLLINNENNEIDNNQALFDMTDLPQLKSSEFLKKNKNKPKHLVFSNGGIERIHGLVDWKKKGFGMTILNGMYELCGIIVHQSMSHYFSYFKAINGKWYTYDDILSDSSHLCTNEIGYGVFKDTRIEQPAMFFYILIN